MPRLFQPSVSCPACSKPNDFDFRYCQRCGYQRQTRSYKALKSLKAPVDLCSIRERKKVLVAKQQATPYQKQRSALEMEFLQFLETTSKRDICAAIPDDVVDFLIWKDNFGKTVVHMVACPFSGENRVSSCVCPKRLAYGSVDSIIGKLRAMFNKYGRSATDSLFPGIANPAASPLVKSYLSAVREEQLSARVVQKQAEPFFLQDLVLLSSEITERLNSHVRSSVQLFVLARDQAFFKVQFFSGDRAGDLGRVKTKGILYFPEKKALLFNHTLTKSLRDGTSNVFALKRHPDSTICPVTAVEVYIAVCDLLKISIRQGYLFRLLNPSGEILPAPFESATAQARLSTYVRRIPAFVNRNVTLHGLRSGCAISLAISGAKLDTIIDHVGWKSSSTARHYIKLNQVLGLGGAADTMSSLEVDLTKVYKQYNDLQGFTFAF